MSAEWHRYKQGVKMLAEEFRTEAGARLFGEVVWLDHITDRVTAQIPLPGMGDVVWQNVYPVEPQPTLEQQHLAEVRELKNGTTRLI